ncbi:MAG: hypothetical protein HZB98_05885 [Bacteroidia bacterium]|nr:hypothetical protein [Bacteroidia bacterium]
MKKTISLIPIVLLLLLWQTSSIAQYSEDAVFPVKGFCINAPSPQGLDRFVKFIGDELAPRGVNTLFLLGDYNYQFESYPQLADSNALSKKDVKKIVAVCRKHNIRIIPQINQIINKKQVLLYCNE